MVGENYQVIQKIMSGAAGKIQVYTGYGKGKTTAALGLAIRALGRSKKVAIVYFDKGGSHYGERTMLDKLVGKNFTSHVPGAPRFDPQAKTFRFGVEEQDKAEALRGLQIVKDFFEADQLDLLVLDEINSTIALGMLKLESVLALLEQKPGKLELVLTGRDCPQALLDKADLVTEMKMIKHYFYQGQEAREGIEY